MAAQRDDDKPLTPRSVTALAFAAPIVGVIAIVFGVVQVSRGDSSGWFNILLGVVLLVIGAGFIRAARLGRASREK